jgi:tetratricopeptide (TPR) repeat protein
MACTRYGSARTLPWIVAMLGVLLACGLTPRLALAQVKQSDIDDIFKKDRKGGQGAKKVEPAPLSPAQQAEKLERARELQEEVVSLFDKNRHREAVPITQEILAIRIEVFGRAHEETFKAFNQLAKLLKFLGDLPGARRNLEEALAVRKELYGEKHVATAMALSDLGVLLLDMGDFRSGTIPDDSKGVVGREPRSDGGLPQQPGKSCDGDERLCRCPRVS